MTNFRWMYYWIVLLDCSFAVYSAWLLSPCRCVQLFGQTLQGQRGLDVCKFGIFSPAISQLFKKFGNFQQFITVQSQFSAIFFANAFGLSILRACWCPVLSPFLASPRMAWSVAVVQNLRLINKGRLCGRILRFGSCNCGASARLLLLPLTFWWRTSFFTLARGNVPGFGSHASNTEALLSQGGGDAIKAARVCEGGGWGGGGLHT